MQQFLKPAPGTTGAQVVSAEFFGEFLLTVDDAESLLHAGFGWETSATFADHFERVMRVCVGVGFA